MRESFYDEPDYTYIEYLEPEIPPSLPVVPATGVPVIFIAGASGPNVTFSGTTGLSFTGGGSVVTVAGVLVVSNGGTGRATLGANGVLIGQGTGAINITGAGTAGQLLTSNGAGVDPTFQSAPAAGANTALSNLASVAINAALVLGTSDAFALGSATKQWSDLFLAEGGVINWDNGDATLTQAGNVLTLAGADFVADNVTVNTALLPDANDGAALGTTALQFSDLFLAEGGVINWDNGDATLTQAGNVVTLAGADLALANMTSGSVLFAGASGLVSQDNAGLFFDATNNSLGIGTATPFTAAGYGILAINGSTGGIFELTTGGTLKYRFQTDGTNAYLNNLGSGATIYYNNSVAGITLSAANAVRFHAYGAGTATFDASGNITSVSDERLKRNIRPFERSTKAIMGIVPILHGYNKKSGLDQKWDDYVGFSAQNVLKYIPEAVGNRLKGSKQTRAKRFYSLNINAIVAALVNTVQAQQIQIEKLLA